MSKSLRISYRSKILIAVLLSAYIPVAAGIVYTVGFQSPPAVLYRVLGAVLFTVLMGGALTLFLLMHLLKPIAIASDTLRNYAASGVIPELPTDLEDEAGQLLADAHNTIRQMDKTFRNLADFDQVTGLPNHQSFERKLRVHILSGRPFALCAMDFSNYDRIAQAFGQQAVDVTCRHLAQRFLETLGDGAHVGRISAKTFLFELGLLDGEEMLATRVEEIRLHLEKDPSLAEYNVFPELNAGISVFRGGQDDVDAGALIDEAVSAIPETYATKIRTQFFSAKHALAARETLMIERDLRMAIGHNQLSLHYQPFVDLASGRVVGAEALVRWTHPERGAVSPGVFIPIAEKSGLIDELGVWILGETCRQLNLWAATDLRRIKLSMNLSVRQFLSPRVVQQILEALTNSEVETERLEVELTETTMIEDHARTREVLEDFRSRGITTAIDDFGAGFSSLSYLKTMPFDRIKIDREFVRDVDQSSKSSAICRALIELANGLEIEVLAEGTETHAEVERLRELGCTLFQGYYFSRPVPPEMFPEAMRKCEAIAEQHRGVTLPSEADQGSPAWMV